ncbi:MAG: hypothetical protein ACKOC5_19055 [Chloroflexota bacterium]
MLNRMLRFAAGAALACLVLLLLIPSDSPGALLGFSARRLALLGGLLLAAVLPAGVWIVLRRRPEPAAQLERRLAARLEDRRVRLALPLAAGMALNLVLMLSMGAAFYFSDVTAGLLLRLAPPGMYVALLALAALAWPAAGGLRQPWPRALLLANLYALAGSLLTPTLLAGLPARLQEPLSSTGFLLAWAATWLLSLAWLAWIGAAPAGEARLWRWVGLLALVVLALHWRTYPSELGGVSPALAVLLPPLLPLALLLTRLALRLYDGLLRRPRLCRWAGVAAVLAVLALGLAYSLAASQHAHRINTDLEQRSQGRYLKAARLAWESGFTDPGDFNRTPLYPYFQGLFYRPGLSLEQFFAESKQRNILLSLVVLVGVFGIFRSRLPLSAAALAALIAAFGLIIFKAAYVKAEVLYYGLALACFALMLQLLRRPSLLLAALGGALAGLTYLSKATVLLSVVIFSAVCLLRLAAGWWAGRRRPAQPALAPGQAQPGAAQRIQWRRELACLALFLLVFVAAVYPYGRITLQRFGSYFFNVNTAYYIWFDNFQDAVAFDEAYGLSQGRTSLPADQLPGPLNYLRGHTSAQIVQRLRVGLEAQLENFFSAYSLTNFPLVYLAALALAAAAAPRRAWGLLRRRWVLALFAGLYFGLQFASFVWYTYISAGTRFLHGLYLPLLFCLLLALQALGRPLPGEQPPARPSAAAAEPAARLNLARFALAVNLLMGVLLMLNIWFTLQVALMAMQYGS